MPDNPPNKLGHRRAQSHSDILTLPDDICFDSDIGWVWAGEGPSLSDETDEDFLSMYLDVVDKFNPSASEGFAVALGGDASNGSTGKHRVRHQHSQSMDGSMSMDPDMFVAGSAEVGPGDPKKAMSDAKLAELALVDPKRAKKMWANRQSAARSKERKIRYIAELERKVQMLQTEAASRSAELALMQRDANDLNAENSELKLHLKTTEQQVHLQDALSDALKEEVQHLKRLTAQAIPNCGQMMNLPTPSGSSQLLNPQELQIHPRTQQHQQ